MQIESDSLTQLARQKWQSPNQAGYDSALVSRIYQKELNGAKSEPPKLRRVMLLEISQYLEHYLIPHCSEVPSLALLILIYAENKSLHLEPKELKSHSSSCYDTKLS